MYYKLTLTTSGGFTHDNLAHCKIFFQKYNHVHLVVERGDGGNRHVEGVVEIPTKKTSNVTRTIRSLYDTMGLEVTDYSIRVRQATHLIGALIYGRKELKAGGSLLVLKGWTSTWIDEQIKNNVKSIPYKLLKSKGTRLTNGIAPALIYEWCVANNMIIEDKNSMIEVAKSMASEGYLFGSLKPSSVYIDICALFHNGRPTARWFENELHFL